MTIKEVKTFISRCKLAAIMDKRKITFLCLIAATVLQLSHGETKVFLPGEDLEGPNVCKRIITHNVTVVVTEMVPYQESKMEWCAAFPPRCRKTVIKLKQVNKTEVLEKTQAIRECCEGYKENEQKNRCIPHCQMPCSSSGTCIAPNVCKCDSGYGGPSCNITCPPSLYGNKCKKKCDCANGADCDPYDGSCHCKKGFQGTKCENSCTPDRYGEGCQEVCRCQNGGKCNHISGECYCQKGYTGPLCEEKCKSGRNGDECKSICRCQNGGICDEENQSCKCPPGWVGSVCANRCQPGFYGINCTHVCECFNGASCDHVSGACICEPGFMGEKCLDQCPFNKYGVDCTEDCVCTNGATCDKGTGKCHCVLGWAGEDCSERQCPDDMYGETCNETCECEKDNTESCHPHDGKCECKEGWTGTACNRPCPFLKYGKSCAYQCDCRNNAQCQPTDGKCICPPGFTGEKCESHCPEGTYGQDCSQRCECKNGAKCSYETGECFCKPGWQGLQCERPCELNTYGQGCSKKCECLNNGACHPINGECYCAVGWTGKNCENKCDSWTFGQNCSFECICERQNTLACDHQTGRCLCRTEHRGSQTIKYAGVKCESTCPLGYYGSECHHQCNCKNNSSCDPTSGECICDRGWMGKTCDQKCPNGYFGQNCMEKCPENMPPKTTCDHVTGEFKCRPGYIGPRCDHACKAGSYGEDCKYECKCEQGECHHVDGICRCYPGWWGEFCDQPCPEDTWGTGCQHKCQCSNNAQCRKTDGLCICKAGFMGPKCEEVCPEGFFGNNCLEVCTCNRKPNFVCHPSHGCVCKAGWRGKNCDESIYSASTAEEEEFNTTDSFASTSDEENFTIEYESSSQSSITTIHSITPNHVDENESNKWFNKTSIMRFPETTKFTFIPLETTTSSHAYIIPTLHARTNETDVEITTKFTFAPLHPTTHGNIEKSTKPSTFLPINSESTTNKVHPSSSSEVVTNEDGHENKLETTTTSLMPVNTINYSSTTLKEFDDRHELTTKYEDQNNSSEIIDLLTTMRSIENVSAVETSINDTMNPTKEYETDKSHNNGERKSTEGYSVTDKNVVTTDSSLLEPSLITAPIEHDFQLSTKIPLNFGTEVNLEKSTKDEGSKIDIEKTANVNNPNEPASESYSQSSHVTRFDMEYLNDRYNKEIHLHEQNGTRQLSTINPNAISNNTKIDDAKVDGNNEHSWNETEQMKLKEEEKPSVSRSGMVWGVFCTFLFLGIIATVILFYRRRVANLKAEIVHVVRYMNDDPNRNFDNPVYSYQPSINTDTSTLLHRNGVMNNLRQTRPSNLERLNNFDQDSNSSGRAAQYSLNYDAELMNQKNHEADQTNPNFYSSIDDHLYDEIKLKCADLDMEYDHLDYSRPQQPIVPHYHRATSSTMSTLSQRNRESDQSNNKFPSNFDSTYDAPVPHPKKLNISVPLPPLPAKNINSNLTPSPSSSTASTVTQDDNLDVMIAIEKPINKDLNSKPDVMNQQTDN